MATRLTAGESVIKSWDYGTVKERTKTTANLTVTNKRIISTISDKKSIDREEVPLSSVKSITGAVNSPKARWYVILIGIIFLITIIIGIAILVAEYKRCHSATLTLAVITEGFEGTPLEIGMSSIKDDSWIGKLLSGRRKPIIKVNYDAAKDIVENLGSIVWANK